MGAVIGEGHLVVRSRRAHSCSVAVSPSVVRHSFCVLGRAWVGKIRIVSVLCRIAPWNPMGTTFWAFVPICILYEIRRLLHPGYLWNLQVKLQPIVSLLPDKGRLMDFLLQRKECKMVILSVCSQSKWTSPPPRSLIPGFGLCCPHPFLGAGPHFSALCTTCSLILHLKGGLFNPLERR